MDVPLLSSGHNGLPRRARLRIAVVGGAVHGLLAIGARAVAASYINRPDEGCDDAGPCFAVGVDQMFRVVTAVPLLYGATLALWAGVLWVLLRKTAGATGRALGAVGFQLLIAPPVIFAAALAGRTAVLAAAVAAVTVLPGVLAWRSSGFRPGTVQQKAAELTSI